jgi:non-canonical purine NTP pyrophosphatase (RdgB/HAM1 family)
MKKFTFVTGNPRKIRDMRTACAEFNIEVEQKDLDMDEIQSHDPHLISLAKAEKAFELNGDQPVVINDAFWQITTLKGFPGGYMKDMQRWLEPQDWIALMAGKQDRRISCTETIIYKDANQTHVIAKEFWGEVTADQPKGEGTSMEQVVFIDGRSIAEYANAHEHAFKEYIWHDFARWFADQPGK